MLNLAKDIQSLSHFKRKTAACVAQLKETGHPLVLTVNGKAALVVQDAAAYQQLREQADRAEMLDFLEESRRDAQAGRTVPAREALRRLAKKHRLPTRGA
jgi:prevent-host-death family protein